MGSTGPWISSFPPPETMALIALPSDGARRIEELIGDIVREVGHSHKRSHRHVLEVVLDSDIVNLSLRLTKQAPQTTSLIMIYFLIF